MYVHVGLVSYRKKSEKHRARLHMRIANWLCLAAAKRNDSILHLYADTETGFAEVRSTAGIRIQRVTVQLRFLKLTAENVHKIY